MHATDGLSPPQDAPPARIFAAQAVHAVRTTTIVNLTMSQLADQKASMLMGAAFVVFSLTLGAASRGHAPLALLVLGAFAFAAAILAVSVVMPATGEKHAPTERDNPMFFGVISQFDEDAYVERMLDNLATDETMFRMMLRDIWQNSCVLQRKKYRLLGWAYRIFLTGLVASAGMFAAQYAGLIG
jgi:hypothetical protein